MTGAAAPSIALSLGISALVTVVCRRIRIPALLPLMLVGLGLGNSGLGVVDAASLGGALKGIITVGIGLLIFEGALHLNKEEFSRAPRAVWGLMTIGAVLTWIGATCAARFLLDMTWPISILLGATLIVTGPTVVQPILRLLRLSPSVHTALSAEAVLIDPVGVVATVTTLEVLRLFLTMGPELGVAGEGLWLFSKPFIGGAGVGVISGVLGLLLLRAYAGSGKVESPLLNLIAVGVCMTCVGVGEAITPEAGLAAVTICGVIMARARVLGATELRSFKELLAVMLVGTLFVLLASRFDISQLEGLTWREVVFVLALLFVVRPVAVAAATFGSKLTMGERLFAGTFAPRGIVALSVATVAAAELGSIVRSGSESAHLAASESLLADIQRLEPIMFLTIAGTVLIASTFSPALAWILGLKPGEGLSVIVVGGHPIGIAAAKELQTCGVECRIIDSNDFRVAIANSTGIEAVVGDATDSRWMDDVGSPHGAGWLLAWTGNHDVDQMAARWGMDRLGEDKVAIWSSKPARGELEPVDISAGEPITNLLERFEDGHVRLAHSSDPGRLQRILGWVCESRFVLNGPNTKPPPRDKECVYIGLGGAESGEPAGFKPEIERPVGGEPSQHAEARTA
ncbi:MAG: cation:proton antiporter [Phycisphaeraceae bacterium]|nr:cation:proton antiporter [Phycisphaeraceae bacterium]